MKQNQILKKEIHKKSNAIFGSTLKRFPEKTILDVPGPG